MKSGLSKIIKKKRNLYLTPGVKDYECCREHSKVLLSPKNKE
jgi:hypothetical protein